jgi:hypothetical protein
VGDTILYAGYGSPSLRLAAVVALRERDARPELLVKLHAGRGHVSILHYPRRTYVVSRVAEAAVPPETESSRVHKKGEF